MSNGIHNIHGQNIVLLKKELVDFFHQSDNSPFYKSGFKNWKNAMNKNFGMSFPLGHDKSITHKICMFKWDGYKQSQKTISNQTQLNVANESLIRENCYYIYNIAEFIII